MKRTIITLVCLIFSAIVLSGQTASVPKDWKTYSGTEYSIRYPQNWQATVRGAQLILMQKRTDNTSFVPSVNIIIEGRKRTESTKYLAEGPSAQAKKMGLLEGNAVVDPVSLSGLSGHRWSGVLVQQGFRIYERQYVVKEADNTTYILTLAVDESKKASQLPTAQTILSSFQIK